MNAPTNVRMVSLEVLLKEVLPNFVQPVPSKVALRKWLDAANVKRFKPNPIAKRGGGPCYYEVAGVEKMLRNRMLGKR